MFHTLLYGGALNELKSPEKKGMLCRQHEKGTDVFLVIGEITTTDGSLNGIERSSTQLHL